MRALTPGEQRMAEIMLGLLSDDPEEVRRTMALPEAKALRKRLKAESDPMHGSTP